MKLLKLTLRNFKALREFTLEPKGQDLSVYARNGVGKSTIIDSVFWLLFGKDSLGRSLGDDIKTLDPKTGEAIHNLEHQAAALFDLGDGETVELSKTYMEVWEVKHGGTAKRFTKHKTDHRVNGVPVSEGQYQEHVAHICTEERLRQLMDCSYVAQTMKWQDRRRILIDICGDVTDQDVIASSKKLKDLPSILGRHSLDDYRKIIVARRKEVNKGIADLPPRFDEVRRRLNAAPETSPDPKPLRDELQNLQEERTRIETGGEIAEKTKKLRELESAAIEILNALKESSGKGFDEAQTALRAAELALAQAETDADNLRRILAMDESAHTQLTGQRAALLEEYKAEAAKGFEFSGESVCAACGQDLPEDKVEAARAKAEEQFNQRKAEALEANKAKGLATKDKLQTIAEKIARRNDEIAAAQAKVTELAEVRDAAKQKAESLKEPALDPMLKSPAYAKNKIAQEELQFAIRDLGLSSESASAAIDAKIAALRAQIAEAEQVAAQVQVGKEAATRILELEAEELALSAEIERIDREIFLTEEFIRTKVRMLTERINSRFKVARFNLFETQINEGLKELCEVTYLGAPPSHGQWVMVGLDMVNVLSEHYGFAPVCFVDNAESVTQIPETRGQQIRLVHSAEDETLRIEALRIETLTESQKEAIPA